MGGLAGFRLKVVLDYIEGNLANQITLRRMAELAGGPRHFQRAFRQGAGMLPHAYVMRTRLDRNSIC